jgi:hypothetical protein
MDRATEARTICFRTRTKLEGNSGHTSGCKYIASPMPTELTQAPMRTVKHSFLTHLCQVTASKRVTAGRGPCRKQQEKCRSAGLASSMSHNGTHPRRRTLGTARSATSLGFPQDDRAIRQKSRRPLHADSHGMRPSSVLSAVYAPAASATGCGTGLVTCRTILRCKLSLSKCSVETSAAPELLA